MVSRGTKILAIIVAVCVALTTAGQSVNELQEGDLLFCCTNTANAITAVTSGVEDLPIDHVAVFHRIGGENGISLQSEHDCSYFFQRMIEFPVSRYRR